MSWIAVWDFTTGELKSLTSSIPENIRNPLAPILYEVDADGNEVLDADGNLVPQTDADGNPLRDPNWVQPLGFTEWADRAASGEFKNEWNTETKAFDIPKPVPPYRWSRNEFRMEFTLQQRAAIRAARSSDIVVDDFMDFLDNADYVSSDDVNFPQGMGYLLQQGYIDQATHDTIMGRAQEAWDAA